MNLHASPRNILAAWSAMLCLAFGVARADDTEIFVATPPTTIKTSPNILFVIDTSGSMDTKVTTQPTYDSATTYSGNCPAGRIYWQSDGNTPKCSGDNFVSDANFVCQSARNALNTIGFKTQGPAAQWDDRDKKPSKHKWKGLAADFDSYVECKADEAIPHGDGTATHLYAANASNGPFSSNSSQAITWTTNGTDGTYTFYTSNWLNWKKNTPTTTTKTRLEIVQEVAKNTLDGLSGVNVGLMRYSTNAEGGMVIAEMGPIDTARTDLDKKIAGLTADGYTPLSETFFEAYSYFAGTKVEYGMKSTPSHSTDASMISDKSKYISPIGSACQKNFVIYLTDGEPTQDSGAEDDIEALPNFKTLLNRDHCTDNGSAGGSGGAEKGDGKCFDDLAKYMYMSDFYDDPAALPADEAKENVTTYTIGFGDGVSAQGLNLLKVAAEGDPLIPGDHGGGGKFFLAGDTAELTEVFQNIIQKILSDNISFTAPTVSVNAFNRTQNLNDLFITVFGPADTYHWPGNLKKYRLDEKGVIQDANGKTAVDESTGFFQKTAQSFWSDSLDGINVADGGAAHEQKPPLTRSVFTDVAAPGNNELFAPANALAVTNTAIDRAMLGMDTTVTPPAPDVQLTALIEWIRGADAVTSTAARFTMGDPLHARPVSVIYGGTTTTKNLDDAVVYTATNDGYLHAINPTNGSELWTYIPSELLPRMNDLQDNDVSAFKRYGLDGSLRAFKLDRNNDGVIDPATDKVYLYFGMGRGGSTYYALDITDKNKPKLLWKHGAADTLIGLGQSWSTPVVTMVKVSDKSQNPDKLVVIVGGGYDPTQDNVPYNTDDTGNRLFMLDAVTGGLLWHAGPDNIAGLGYDSSANLLLKKLYNSIPSDIRVLDTTNDGFADRMYVGDTGGQVWRFDITNGNSAAGLVAGGVIASLGRAAGSGSTALADSRRFYNAPDISLLKADGKTFINIAIGSGYRGHPLNQEIHDRFYSLRDYRPFTSLTQTQYDTPETVTPILDSDTTLVDVTTNVTPTIPPGAPGWKLSLNATAWRGEKVLAEARTFGGVILFTTFTPVSSSHTACTVKAGSNALYAVSALDASPPFADRDGNGTLDAADRSSPLDQHGIAPEAVILFPSPDDPLCKGKACSPPPVCIVGVESCGVKFGNDPKKTFWMQKDAD